MDRLLHCPEAKNGAARSQMRAPLHAGGGGLRAGSTMGKSLFNLAQHRPVGKSLVLRRTASGRRCWGDSWYGVTGIGVSRLASRISVIRVFLIPKTP